MMLRVQGSNYCRMHGGHTVANTTEKENIRRYNVAKWRAKIERHAGSSDLTNLNEEIGVLRMLLEEHLNRCENDVDLVTMTPVMADLVMKIDKVVNSCHKLQDRLGHLLDKNQILQFASLVVEIISTHVEDSEVVAIIANRIAESLNAEG